MTAFTLKAIALVAMFADHVAVVFPYHIPIEFRAVGRLAWPIFAYLLAEGFRHTKAPDMFMMRLFALAVVSQIPYSMAITWATQQDYMPWTQAISFVSGTNIFYTLFLGGAAITIYKWLEAQGLKLTAYTGAVFPTAVLAELLSADYGGMGVLFIFCMYAIANKRHRLIALGVFSLSQFFPVMLLLTTPVVDYRFTLGTEHILMMAFALSTVGLLALYNGKRGIGMKWLFYAAYPVHLSVLAVAAVLLNRA